MRRIDALIIGGGQAGLAMSRCLADRRVDHVVLERGRIAERWRRERWDSLRLLTPNWMTRLPGSRYTGPDPDGYMRVPEVVRFLEDYAQDSDAPVVTDAAVLGVTAAPTGGYHVESTAGHWHARQVVVATGHCDTPRVPAMAASAPGWVHQLTPSDYRNPAQLPPGGVLVVGASASGLQLADELARAGRAVTLAAGQHTRVPRLYRGRDLFYWLERLGLLRQSAGDVVDLAVSRAQPSFQLVGRPTHDTIDLRGLAARGVAAVGRLAGLDDGGAWFDDDLIASTAAADLKLALLLGRIDRLATADGAPPAPPFVPHWPAFIDGRAGHRDFRRDGIATIVWATGYRRHYDWLRVPVLDGAGEIVHDGGVTPSPGLFVLGLQFLRHRSSSFLDGVGVDADHLAGAIARNLGRQGAAA
ncbi:MAG: NAD(P)-binding domain-containing protein [Vicinamibacterales bacterium]